MTVAEEKYEDEEPGDDGLLAHEPEERGYGQLFRSLIGNDATWLRSRLSKDESERDEDVELIAKLMNGSDYAVERIVSQRLLQDPDELSGFIVGETAVLFTAAEDASGALPGHGALSVASPTGANMSITSLKTIS
ncbi:hypothetical protein [Arthrobacter sp. GCM10027362]|uniref:hypothetical protein n=1 Tax=Arthrobacter sp. GCM10027362 TaxID=3273379 RepID=UPI00366ED214